MALLPDGLYIAWSAAGGFATLALATGGRAIFTQWRANAASSRQAEDWTTITDAASDFCSGDETSAAIVLRALARPSSQRIAIEALANLARVDSRVPESLRGETEMVEHIRSFVARELAHSDAGRRCAGAEIVGALRLRACRGAVALATSDDEPEVRVAACRALAVVDPDHAVGVLLGLVERDGAWAADLLADIVSREDGAFSGSEAVVQRANEWAATPALLRLLSNGRIAGAERVMIGALDAEADEVRASAAEALRESGTPDAITALAGLLNDSNELIRLTAVRAVGQSQDGSYSMDLAAMLGDESRLVRFAAGAALASKTGGRALLLRASEGSDPKAVEAAHVSLWQAEQVADIEQVAQVKHVEQGKHVEHIGEPPTTSQPLETLDRARVVDLRLSPTPSPSRVTPAKIVPGQGLRTPVTPAAIPTTPATPATVKPGKVTRGSVVTTAKTAAPKVRAPSRSKSASPKTAAKQAAKTSTAKTSTAKTPTAKTSAAKVAKTPTTMKPTAKTPTAKTPTAKAPTAKTPTAKTPTRPTVKATTKAVPKRAVKPPAQVIDPVVVPRPASALPRLSRSNASTYSAREMELAAPTR